MSTAVLALATALATASLGAISAPLTMPTRRPRVDAPAVAPRRATGETRRDLSSRRHRRSPRRAPSPAGPSLAGPSLAGPATGTPSSSAADWATLLDVVSTQLRSGDSLLTAWSAALSERPIQGQVVAPGRSLAATVAATTTDADEAVVVQAVAAAMALGGPMAATIDAAAALLRERDAIRAEASAHSAQARLSARVLTAVPLLFAAWSSVTSESFRNSLGTPVGLVCIALGGLLNLGGWRWMRRIVAGAAR